jgi:hypothetical protein
MGVPDAQSSVLGASAKFNPFDEPHLPLTTGVNSHTLFIKTLPEGHTLHAGASVAPFLQASISQLLPLTWYPELHFTTQALHELPSLEQVFVEVPLLIGPQLIVEFAVQS